VGQDGGSSRDDLPDGRSEIFLQMGLDSQMTDLPVGQFNHNAPDEMMGFAALNPSYVT
jgi:hypothetical protein